MMMRLLLLPGMMIMTAKWSKLAGMATIVLILLVLAAMILMMMIKLSLPGMMILSLSG